MDGGNFAYVTLATNDNYGNGALVLAHSLKLVDTKHKLVVLVTGGVTSSLRDKLKRVFDIVEDVSTLDSNDDESLALLERSELGVTFTKLHCWRLTQFSKCVFLDADTLILKNCDELFDKTELSAVPDIGWPDCFNSGVFVFKPSNETYGQLIKMACDQGSFDGGDQGLLNTFFSNWATQDISRHLSFVYNMNANSSYTYLPAFNQFGKNVKIVHFLGTQKPWMFTYNKDSETVDAPIDNNPSYEYMSNWWKIFTEHVEDKTPENVIAENLSNISLSPKQELAEPFPVPDISVSDNADRLYAWEQGRIDYMGRDSYENIQRKLDEVINGTKA